MTAPGGGPTVASAEAEVRHHVDGGVATITIDRPEARNALSWRHRDRLVALLDEASTTPTTRVVVLTGTGPSFCAGADLKHPMPTAPRPPGGPASVVGDLGPPIRSAQAVVAAVLDTPKPVIAAVNGVAAGLGAQLALACDFVVASRSARIAELFVRRAIVPDGGPAYLLPRLVGPHLARRLLLLGEDLPLDLAHRLGVLHDLVDPEELDGVVAELAARLAVAPTTTLGLTKGLLNRSADASRAQAFDDEVQAQERNVATLDAIEGLASFREGRPPTFRGC